MPKDTAMLADVPMFALLDEAERETLAELLEVESYAAGDRIFNYGDAGGSLYIVQNGTVRIFVESNEGQTIVLAENDRGDIFGEVSMLDGGARTASAIALADVELLSLDRQDLLDFVTRHPHAALDLLTVMGRRLRATDELLRSHVTRNLNVEEEERMTLADRIADHVAAFGGSWTFIGSFSLFLLLWMAYNDFVLHNRGFDPYPFILLNLILSSIASFQAPVIMMSQNRQGAKDRLQADLDYQVNLKAELEVAHLHNKVDRIYEEMQSQFARLGGDRTHHAGLARAGRAEMEEG